MHLYSHNRNDYDFAEKWKKIKRKPIFMNKEADLANLRFKVLYEKEDKAADNLKEVMKVDNKVTRIQKAIDAA